MTITRGISTAFQRIAIYGPGGVGKSELASLLKLVGIKPLFFDIGNGTQFLDVDRVAGIDSWDELRSGLQDMSLAEGFGAIVLDDMTKAEELAALWTLANRPKELKGGEKEICKTLEDYGWGKGVNYLYDTYLQILGDLDAHIRAGRQVICIAHECTTESPNPYGEDFLRFEPRLQSPKKNQAASIRLRLKEWCDHLLFVGFDVLVNREGKAQGSGTRTIYPAERPTHMAKSRCLTSPIAYQRGSADLWKQLFGGPGNGAS